MTCGVWWHAGGKGFAVRLIIMLLADLVISLGLWLRRTNDNIGALFTVSAQFEGLALYNTTVAHGERFSIIQHDQFKAYML